MNKDSDILIIKSELSEIKRVEQFLFRIFEKKRLPQKFFNKVYLCISEAVINAIEHGNKGDIEKDVVIKIECNLSCLNVFVHDEGNGFNYGSVKDPTRSDNLMNEGGRGIYIMKSICSELSFSNDGTSVEIKIDLS